jgi:hypothetical protein
MNATNLLNTKAVTVGVGLIVGGALLYWVANKVIDKTAAAAGAVGRAVNPASDQNLAYQGVNVVGAAVSGRSSWTLGTWLYDITHPGESAAIRSSGTYQPRKLTVREESSVFDWLTDHG